MSITVYGRQEFGLHGRPAGMLHTALNIVHNADHVLWLGPKLKGKVTEIWGAYLRLVLYICVFWLCLCVADEYRDVYCPHVPTSRGAMVGGGCTEQVMCLPYKGCSQPVCQFATYLRPPVASSLSHQPRLQ